MREAPMRIKGALHVHSGLSRDGTMSIEKLARYYKRKGYQFLAMGEHGEDLDESKVQALRELSAQNTNEEFCVIPGIEFATTRNIHIVGVGTASLVQANDPRDYLKAIREQNGFAVLAHPKRMDWECPTNVLFSVDAIEIWNVGYDGKYLPSAKALRGFRRMQQINPKLLAVASHDFHRAASFYDVAIEMDVPSISADAILRNLRQGMYLISSRFFRADSGARLSKMKIASISLASQQLSQMRKLRTMLLG
jgi:hypothetical protein